MNRTTHFAIGAAIILLCVLWCLVGVAWVIGLGLSRDSMPAASVFDSSFMTFYILWGSGFLLCLWAAFRSFRQALRRPVRLAPTPTPSPSGQQPDLATPDEKLAHLVKK